MSTFIAYYNFKEKQLSGPDFVDFDNETIKIALLDSNYVPDLATDQYWSDVSSFEVIGNNYTSLGEIVNNISVSDVSGNAEVYGDPVSWVASQTGFTDAKHALMIKDTGNPSTSILIGVATFANSISNTSGNVNLNWGSGTILTFLTRDGSFDVDNQSFSRGDKTKSGHAAREFSANIGTIMSYGPLIGTNSADWDVSLTNGVIKISPSSDGLSNGPYNLTLPCYSEVSQGGKSAIITINVSTIPNEFSVSSETELNEALADATSSNRTINLLENEYNSIVISGHTKTNTLITTDPNTIIKKFNVSSTSGITLLQIDFINDTDTGSDDSTLTNGTQDVIYSLNSNIIIDSCNISCDETLDKRRRFGGVRTDNGSITITNSHIHHVNDGTVSNGCTEVKIDNCELNNIRVDAITGKQTYKWTVDNNEAYLFEGELGKRFYFTSPSGTINVGDFIRGGTAPDNYVGIQVVNVGPDYVDGFYNAWERPAPSDTLTVVGGSASIVIDDITTEFDGTHGDFFQPLLNDSVADVEVNARNNLVRRETEWVHGSLDNEACVQGILMQANGSSNFYNPIDIVSNVIAGGQNGGIVIKQAKNGTIKQNTVLTTEYSAVDSPTRLSIGDNDNIIAINNTSDGAGNGIIDEGTNTNSIITQNVDVPKANFQTVFNDPLGTPPLTLNDFAPEAGQSVDIANAGALTVAGTFRPNQPIIFNFSNTALPFGSLVEYSTDTNNGNVFVLVDQTPSRTATEIVAGGGDFSTNDLITDTGVQSGITVESLLGETTYYLHMVHRDENGVYSRVINEEFTTVGSTNQVTVLDQSSVILPVGGSAGKSGMITTTGVSGQYLFISVTIEDTNVTPVDVVTVFYDGQEMDLIENRVSNANYLRHALFSIRLGDTVTSGEADIYFNNNLTKGAIVSSVLFGGMAQQKRQSIDRSFNNGNLQYPYTSTETVSGKGVFLGFWSTGLYSTNYGSGDPSTIDIITNSGNNTISAANCVNYATFDTGMPDIPTETTNVSITAELGPSGDTTGSRDVYFGIVMKVETPLEIPTKTFNRGEYTLTGNAKIELSPVSGTIASIGTPTGSNVSDWVISNNTSAFNGEIIITPAQDGLLNGPYELTIPCYTQLNQTGDLVNAVVTINTIDNTYSVYGTTEFTDTLAFHKNYDNNLSEYSAPTRTIMGSVSAIIDDTVFNEYELFVSPLIIETTNYSDWSSGQITFRNGLTITNSENITFKGVKFNYNFMSSTSQSTVKLIGTCTDIIFDGCTFEGTNRDPFADYSVLDYENGLGIHSSKGSAWRAARNIVIKNSFFENLYTAVTGTFDGELTIDNNEMRLIYTDAININNDDDVIPKIRYNYIHSFIAKTTDKNNPHIDGIQLQHSTDNDWVGIEIIGNIIAAGNARGDSMQAIFCNSDGQTTYLENPVISNNTLLMEQSTHGITLTRINGGTFNNNTVAKENPDGTYTFSNSIRLGTNASSGNIKVFGNIAEGYTLSGTGNYDSRDNITLGLNGATNSYSSVFDGPVFNAAPDFDTIKSRYSMKAFGPADIDQSGDPSIYDAGSIGSGATVIGNIREENWSVNNSYATRPNSFPPTIYGISPIPDSEEITDLYPEFYTDISPSMIKYIVYVSGTGTDLTKENIDSGNLPSGYKATEKHTISGNSTVVDGEIYTSLINGILYEIAAYVIDASGNESDIATTKRSFGLPPETLPTTINYVGEEHSATNSSTYTFSANTLPTEGKLLIHVTQRGISGSASSVTVGGLSSTIVDQRGTQMLNTAVFNQTSEVREVDANNISGNDIVVTFPSSTNRCGIIIYQIIQRGPESFIEDYSIFDRRENLSSELYFSSSGLSFAVATSAPTTPDTVNYYTITNDVYTEIESGMFQTSGSVDSLNSGTLRSGIEFPVGTDNEVGFNFAFGDGNIIPAEFYINIKAGSKTPRDMTDILIDTSIPVSLEFYKLVGDNSNEWEVTIEGGSNIRFKPVNDWLTAEYYAMSLVVYDPSNGLYSSFPVYVEVEDNAFYLSDLTDFTTVVNTPLVSYGDKIALKGDVIYNDTEADVRIAPASAISGNVVDYVTISTQNGATDNAAFGFLRLDNTNGFCKGFKFENIDFKKATNSGPILAGQFGPTHMAFVNCTFTSVSGTNDSNLGVQITGNGSPVSNYLVDSCNFIGLYDGINMPCADQTIINCVFNGIFNDAIHQAGDVDTHPNNVKILNNKFSNKKYAGAGAHGDFIQFNWGSSVNGPVTGLEIINNKMIRGSGTAGEQDGQGIFIPSLASGEIMNAKINNNFYLGTFSRGISIGGMNGGQIIGNSVLKDLTAGITSSTPQSEIFILDSTGVFVSDNIANQYTKTGSTDLTEINNIVIAPSQPDYIAAFTDPSFDSDVTIANLYTFYQNKVGGTADLTIPSNGGIAYTTLNGIITHPRIQEVNPFAFAPVTDAPLSTTYQTETVVIGNAEDYGVVISVEGGTNSEFRIRNAADTEDISPWGSSSRLAFNGQRVQFRADSSSIGLTESTTQITAGVTKTNWLITSGDFSN